jgi:hypothetical protein
MLRRVPETRFISSLALALVLCAWPLLAQQAPIDPRVPPLPPAPETAPVPPVKTPAPAAPAPPSSVAPTPAPARQKLTAPETVVIPTGTRFDVTLDTPLSTRISKKGQLVNFRTSQPLPVTDDLVIPPDTIFAGKVTEVHRPRGFRKSGVLKVKVERLELSSGAGTDVIARLDSEDINERGKPHSDRSRAADLISLGIWSAQGALIGSQVGGAKGAGIGAGAAAALTLIIMMSKHGADVYLEPGTPFLVELDQPVSLPGKAVLAAQPNAAPNTAEAGAQANSAPGNGASGSNSSTDPATDPSRPQLKRRPKPPQP